MHVYALNVHAHEEVIMRIVLILILPAVVLAAGIILLTLVVPRIIRRLNQTTRDDEIESKKDTLNAARDVHRLGQEARTMEEDIAGNKEGGATRQIAEDAKTIARATQVGEKAFEALSKS